MAISLLAALPALRGRLPHRNFPFDIPAVLADFCGRGENLGPKLLCIFDLDPQAIGQDDHAEGGPPPKSLLDKQAVSYDLEPMARINPLCGWLPLFGDKKIPLS